MSWKQNAIGVRIFVFQESDEKMLTDLLSFINNCGTTIHHAKDIDVIQLGLQQLPSSQVHVQALKLACERIGTTHSAYIKFLWVFAN